MLVGQPVHCGDVLRTDIFSDSENCYWEVDTVTIWHDPAKVHKDIPAGERVFHLHIFKRRFISSRSLTGLRDTSYAVEVVRETDPHWWFWKTAAEVAAERVAEILMEGGTQ